LKIIKKNELLLNPRNKQKTKNMTNIQQQQREDLKNEIVNLISELEQMKQNLKLSKEYLDYLKDLLKQSPKKDFENNLKTN
jgi:hypothetical protein